MVPYKVVWEEPWEVEELTCRILPRTLQIDIIKTAYLLHVGRLAEPWSAAYESETEGAECEAGIGQSDGGS